MHTINLRGIKLFAYHGCLEEEALIGGNYIVNVQIKFDFTNAAISDNLKDTLDYCAIYEIVKHEMAVRSKLIEHVAERITSRIKNEYPNITGISVEVVKLNPPIHGQVDEVSVVIEK